jgi:hypothetical protein
MLGRVIPIPINIRSLLNIRFLWPAVKLAAIPARRHERALDRELGIGRRAPVKTRRDVVSADDGQRFSEPMSRAANS